DRAEEEDVARDLEHRDHEQRRPVTLDRGAGPGDAARGRDPGCHQNEPERVLEHEQRRRGERISGTLDQHSPDTPGERRRDGEEEPGESHGATLIARYHRWYGRRIARDLSRRPQPCPARGRPRDRGS